MAVSLGLSLSLLAFGVSILEDSFFFLLCLTIGAAGAGAPAAKGTCETTTQGNLPAWSGNDRLATAERVPSRLSLNKVRAC